MTELPFLALTGRLYDGLKLWPQATVLLRGDQVLEVAEHIHVPDTATVLHIGPDGTILPGLVDLHVHARPQYAAWFLEAGVTSVRDAGGSLRALAQAAHWAAAGQGPRVYGAGTILDGEQSFFRHFGEGALAEVGDPESGSWIIRTPQDARRAVDTLAQAGAATIKLYEQLPPDAYAAAVRRAHEHGLSVMTDLGMGITRGLKGAQVDALEALQLGVRTIEHASGFALALQRSGLDPAREFPDEAALLALAQAVVDAGVTLVPTLSVYEGLRQEARADLTRLPAGSHEDDTSRNLMAQWTGMHAHSAGQRATAQWDARLAAELARRVVQLGGQVGAGTDTPAGVDNLPGGGLHAELEYLVRDAGMTAQQALHAATGAASSLLAGGDRPNPGTLAPGAAADVLVVRGDPTQDITATRQLQHVILGGQRWAGAASG